MKNHIETITDLLLGAAYADKRLEGREKDKIRALLVKLVGGDLPPNIEARFKEFKPAKFDPSAAGKQLAGLGDDRRKVLEMVAAVADSDDELDIAEDKYIRDVATGMGLAEKEFQDLVVEFQEVDELEGILSDSLGV